jgi:hypothetical protein
MDKLERYRGILKQVIQYYANLHKPGGAVRYEAIVDTANDHYELMSVGWEGDRRIHGCVIHLDLIDGKIWIQYDGTNWPVADELLQAGVPKEDIVLGFQPEEVRPFTEFAVK